MTKVGLVISVAALLLFTNCSKDNDERNNKMVNVTFYTYKTGNWSVKVDLENYVKLKRAVQQPVCGDKLFYNVNLYPGTHNYTLKSDDGYAGGDTKEFTITKESCQTVELK